MVLARAEEMGHHVPQRFKKPLYLTMFLGNGLVERCLSTIKTANRMEGACLASSRAEGLIASNAKSTAVSVRQRHLAADVTL
jgi:hypothetical protein